MQIRINSDQMTRDFVRHRFIEDIEMNGSYGRRGTIYCLPCQTLLRQLNAMQREQESRRRIKPKKPFDGFGSIDSLGRRRGPHGEVVPMDAPACMDVMMEWNDKHQRWE